MLIPSCVKAWQAEDADEKRKVVNQLSSYRISIRGTAEQAAARCLQWVSELIEDGDAEEEPDEDAVYDTKDLIPLLCYARDRKLSQWNDLPDEWKRLVKAGL